MKIPIPKHFIPINLSQVNKAWTQIWHELDQMGFTCRRLSTCQVYVSLAHTAYGYQWFGDREDGRYCGDIILPSVSFSRWGEYFKAMPVTSSLDVLRHEYGHAYADVNRRRIETTKFERAFGYPHGWWNGYEMEYDPEYHVTQYAATAPGEDFAEVFWLYLKHKGRLPGRYDTPPIRKKWKFVENLRKGIR